MSESDRPTWVLGLEFELHVDVLTFDVSFPQRISGEMKFHSPEHMAPAAADALFQELRRSSNVRELKRLYFRKE